ncbi:DUF2382 domain-containing protein [Rhizobium sp. Root1204]|uniref:DUF2382 domain-containing protein n=1 Tax=unclassified Rhizobium TaxID=2613769 RepID=UPI00244E8ECC|nr:DUF2382 domain-containing protein [Rhizobium sp. Root1204]
MTVDKRTVVDGLVTVGTHTQLCDEIATAQLERRIVEVIRVPMDIEVDYAPSMRTEGDVTIVPVFEERMVKRLFLVEEVHLRQQTTSKTLDIPITLRKQSVSIERNVENKEN